MYNKDITKDPNHKLSMWQYWYKLNKETATDLLVDGCYYLLLYDDYKIPVIGRFSKDCNWFELAAPVSSISVDDPKLTHFTDLCSRDEYLELIKKVEQVLDDWVKTKEENNNE